MDTSIKISWLLVQRKIIKQEELHIYAYGLRGLATLSFGTFIIFLIGILLKEIIFTVSFFLAFSSLRAFFPGYHAKKRLTCFILSGLLFIFCIFVGKLWVVNLKLFVLDGTVLFICILMNLSEIILFNGMKGQRSRERININYGMKVSICLFVLLLVLQAYCDKMFFIGIFMAFVSAFALYGIKKL